MKFDVAIRALGTTTWDWSERGFESILSGHHLVRARDADDEMPRYVSPWGKEWVQAIIEDGAVERVEFLVDETSPSARAFSPRKVEALTRKYRDKLAAYVKRASVILGAPTFYGDYETAGFPDDEDGYALAMWRRDTARVMLIARNEGPDTPVWISIVIKPPAGRAPTVRASKPVLRAATRQSSVALGAAAARFDSVIKTVKATRWDWSPATRAAIVAQLAPATCNAESNRIEVVIESTTIRSNAEWNEVDREYLEKLDAYVQRAQRVFGKPKFNDGMSRRGFPKDEKAMVLALWKLKKARLMILYENADVDAPFTISVVVKP